MLHHFNQRNPCLNHLLHNITSAYLIEMLHLQLLIVHLCRYEQLNNPWVHLVSQVQVQLKCALASLVHLVNICFQLLDHNFVNLVSTLVVTCCQHQCGCAVPILEVHIQTCVYEA